MSGTERAGRSGPRELAWPVKLVGGIVILAFFLVASETLLRLFDTDPYYKNQFFPLNRDIDFTEIYKKDHDLFWRFRENHTISSRRFSTIDYHINAAGRRGPDHPVDSDADYRIVALGNSCTFGWGVPYDQIFTTELERYLRTETDSLNFEVINAGVPGYSSYQGKIYFEKELVDLKPDMVLIMFGWNDQWPAGQGICDADQKPPSQLVLTVHNALSPFKLYQFARKLVLSTTETAKDIRLDDAGGPRRVSPDQFFGNLGQIIKTARQNNIQPVLMIPPVASLKGYFKGTSSAFHTLHQKYEDVIRRMARLENVPLVDLQTVFDNFTDLYDDAQGDPVHFNAQGHDVATGEIIRVISPYLPIQKEAPETPADTIETPFATGSR